MSLACKWIDTPVGKLKLVASDEGLVAILWEKDKPRRVPLSEMIEDEKHPILVKTERQLGEYFAGKRKAFSVALDMRGTPFQKNVWEALLAIPFGETRSYGQLAKQLGNPKAMRSRRRSQRKKSGIDHCALPSSDWIVRKTYRLRGRA